MESKELTKTEEKVMQYLWKIGKGFLKYMEDQFPPPGSAYTTVSAVIRVLVKKGFIGYNVYGKIHEYYSYKAVGAGFSIFLDYFPCADRK